ncbi:hypothetical protein MKW92_042181 [Papaver armeniacum]|nr:hypothetical protein MKW92_042181 [Papaver armeniacum]
MDNTVAETLCVQTPNGRVMSSEHPAFWNGIPPNFFVYYERSVVCNFDGSFVPTATMPLFAATSSSGFSSSATIPPNRI